MAGDTAAAAGDGIGERPVAVVRGPARERSSEEGQWVPRGPPRLGGGPVKDDRERGGSAVKYPGEEAGDRIADGVGEERAAASCASSSRTRARRE
mmetsp:Transcript_13441/g.31827  ORF Transcript_13441/g.31827 Transcript_13441/m.31827 type:complete len:95 (+) Transcript_13441:201-485(+)